MRLGFVIDKKNCMACHSCAVACKVENNLPDGVWWDRILSNGVEHRDVPTGTYPDVSMECMPVACQHCSNPACVAVCPTGASHIHEQSGVVLIDTDACIGCQSCIQACPYNVRVYYAEEPAYAIGMPMGAANAPEHRVNTVDKCTMCWHRLTQGYEPACIDACPARIRVFGDFDDPNSEVSKLLAEREYEQYMPEAGTSPNVYYLV